MRRVGILMVGLIGAGLSADCRSEAPPTHGDSRPAPAASQPVAPAPAGAAFASQRPYDCSAGRLIDSAYVVRAAAEAIAGPEGADALAPYTYESVTAQGLLEGILVRLAPRARSTRGGGGLAFVDVESGCAVALRRYE